MYNTHQNGNILISFSWKQELKGTDLSSQSAGRSWQWPRDLNSVPCETLSHRPPGLLTVNQGQHMETQRSGQRWSRELDLWPQVAQPYVVARLLTLFQENSLTLHLGFLQKRILRHLGFCSRFLSSGKLFNLLCFSFLIWKNEAKIVFTWVLTAQWLSLIHLYTWNLLREQIFFHLFILVRG